MVVRARGRFGPARVGLEAAKGLCPLVSQVVVPRRFVVGERGAPETIVGWWGIAVLVRREKGSL